MSRNSFGSIFRFTSFGESHGKGIGVVIDGCPAGLSLDLMEIEKELDRRRPGKSQEVSPRKESDKLELLSGFFQGQTTGAPIAFFVKNQDVDSKKYDVLQDLYRPGHANYSYLEKYGVFDFRGGGRSSARETIARVIAGSVAKQLLKKLHSIEVFAYLKQVGNIVVTLDRQNLAHRQDLKESTLFCPDQQSEEKIKKLIQKIKNEGDSIGGIVEVIAENIPSGWGEPIYEKIEAKLAFAMLSIPASKGFEIGEGFLAAKMKGSDHNDSFYLEGSEVKTKSNHAGGTLGGISSGMPLVFRVPFKPTSSIQKEQETLSFEKKKKTLLLPKGSRHDPCVAIRAVPIVEAMTYIVLADLMLFHRCSKISYSVG